MPLWSFGLDFRRPWSVLHGHRLVRHAIHVVCPDWRGCGCAGSAFRSWVDHGSSVCSQKSPWRVRVSPPRRDHRTRALRYVVDSLRWLGWCLGRPGCSSRRCFLSFRRFREIFFGVSKNAHDTPKKDAWSSSSRCYGHDLSRNPSISSSQSSCFQSTPIIMKGAEQTYVPYKTVSRSP